MKATIAATVARIGGIARERSGGSSFDALDFKLGGREIDIDHDGNAVGEIIHAEVGEDDRIRVVGVLDNGDWLEKIGQPVYLSGTWEKRVSGVLEDSYIAREAQLLGVSLTLDPANLDAQPLRWMLGDLRERTARSHWPISWRTENPLLGRALALHSASRILDRRGDDLPFLREGQQVVPTRPAGGLLYGAPGRVLSVH